MVNNDKFKSLRDDYGYEEQNYANYNTKILRDLL